MLHPFHTFSEKDNIGDLTFRLRSESHILYQVDLSSFDRDGTVYFPGQRFFVMQLAAFQLPAIPKSQSFSTQSRAVPLSTHRPWNWSLPSKLLQPPRSKPPTSSGGRKRQSVAAWLTGHADVIVLSTATVASPAPLRLYGSLTQVLASIRALRISVLYVHMRAVSPVDLTVLRSCQVVPVLVGASGPVAVPAPCVALAMASVAPLLTERKGDAVTHFFDHGIESDAPLRPEVGRLDNTPLTDRITAWITRVYLPQGYPNTTTPDYISFTKFRTLQNLASAVMQVIRLVVPTSLQPAANL